MTSLFGGRHSAVRYVTSDDGTRQRQGHLLSLVPITSMRDGRRVLNHGRTLVELSAFLAFQHIRDRSGEVLPDLPERLANCDFNWTYRHHDSRWSPLHASKEFMTHFAPFRMNDPEPQFYRDPQDRDVTEALSNNTYYTSPNSRQQQQSQEPFAVFGAARSQVSFAVGQVASALEVPQISSSSCANNLADVPFFARTIACDGTAHALMAYLHHMGISHIGLLFGNDAWGRSYQANFAYFGKQFAITIYPVGYTEADADQAMEQLKQYSVNYYLGAFIPSYWKSVVRKAFEHKLMGPDGGQWFLGGMLDLVAPGFTLNRETEWDIAQALHGVGVVQIALRHNIALENALAKVKYNQQLQHEFIQSHQEPQLLENFTFHTEGLTKSYLFAYDAVIALGITACETLGLFSGKEFFDNLLQIDFQGTTGRVNFHPTTGNRQNDFVLEISNVLSEEAIESATSGQKSTIAFDLHAHALVHLTTERNSSSISILTPFIYNDNTAHPPPVLPPLHEEMNLIPTHVLIIGYTLALLVMAQSIGWAVWVYQLQSTPVVRSSQPVFLYQLCLGIFLTAMVIIPLSFQEDMPGLDAACMTIPWFLCIGFCITMSALLAKSLRINKLLNSGTRFRRVKVEPKDAMRPFLALLSINVALLTAWMASPYRLSWQRSPVQNYDEYGRTVESIGMCRPSGGLEYLYFFLPLLLVTIVVIAMATYQTYRARQLPTDFSETSYLWLSMISLSETFILGFTTLASVQNNPSAFYVVFCIVVCIGSMAILLPVFIPKYLRRGDRTSMKASIQMHHASTRRGSAPG